MCIDFKNRWFHCISIFFLQIRIWEVSESQVQCIRMIGGHSNVIVRLVLNGDQRAASRDLDGNIMIWDLNDALTKTYNHEGVFIFIFKLSIDPFSMILFHIPKDFF